MSYCFATLQPSLSNCCLPGTWSRCANKWSGDTVCNEIQFRGNFRAGPSWEALAKFVISCLVVSPLTALHTALRYILYRKYMFKLIYVSWIRIFFFFFSDLFNKCKGDLIEVRDGTLKTHPNLLENLVFFVEVFFPLETRNFWELQDRNLGTTTQWKFFDLSHSWKQSVCCIF